MAYLEVHGKYHSGLQMSEDIYARYQTRNCNLSTRKGFNKDTIGLCQSGSAFDMRIGDIPESSLSEALTKK
jgi:hypothetical protein